MTGIQRWPDGRLASARDQTASVLLKVLDERGDDLRRHLRHVSRLAHAVAGPLGLGEERAEILGRAALFHDIGKVAIPDEILNKPGPLDQAEWHVMRGHTVIGERILAAAPSLLPMALVVRSCHERWDGGGYPDGLQGHRIPFESRLIFLCDAYDAMTSDRPYRDAVPRAEALEELRRCGGTQFDPVLTEAVCDTIEGWSAEERAQVASTELLAVPA